MPDSTCVTNGPRIAALTVLLLEQMAPVIHHARTFGIKRYGSMDAPEMVDWINGAIFGVTAEFMGSSIEDPSVDDVVKLYVAATEVICDMIDTSGGFDLERYAEGVGHAS